jgi:hypothetical protein
MNWKRLIPNPDFVIGWWSCVVYVYIMDYYDINLHDMITGLFQ